MFKPSVFYHRFLDKLRVYSELVLFQHTIFSIPFILIAMLVASKGWFGWDLLLLGILAATAARNFAMGFNRFLDRDIDRLNPRTMSRPNADGRLSSHAILLFVIGNATLFVGIAYLINEMAFLLSFPILGILATYSAMKRFSWFAHIFLGLCLGLAPMAGSVAISESIPLWTLYLSLGVMFWVAGFDLLYALQDQEFDKAHGLFSIPAKFGTYTTLNISRTFHLLTLVCWAFYTQESQRGVFGMVALMCATLFLIWEHWLVHKDQKKINKALFTVNDYLGIFFLIFTSLDFL